MSFTTKFLDISISLPLLGKTWLKNLCADITEAARTVSYVETISNRADCLHKYIKNSDEFNIKKAFEQVSRPRL
jgi:prephenate dehydrogenase